METDKLKKLPLSQEAIEWFERQPDFSFAWQTCERGDWMLDIARRLNIDERKLVLTNYNIVNQIRHLIKNELSLKALDAAYEYGIGRIDRDKLFEASLSARTATFYYQENNLAIHAALAVYDALTPYSTASFPAAFHTAAAFACTTNNTDAKNMSLRESADICRKYLTEEVLTAYNLL